VVSIFTPRSRCIRRRSSTYRLTIDSQISAKLYRSAVVGLTRSYGKILAEEGITFNAVCPNKIRTNIGNAAGYEAAEKAGVLVPMEKLVECFESLLSNGEHKDLSGECFEVAPNLGARIVPKTEFVNEESKISADITYERSHYLHEVVE